VPVGTATDMTPGNGRENGDDPFLKQAKQMVEELQDEVLEATDVCAKKHPECDPQAFAVAVGQAFVAQCLKTYGEQGFEQARKLLQIIVDAMKRAVQDEDPEP
jgi:hypothetical protein